MSQHLLSQDIFISTCNNIIRLILIPYYPIQEQEEESVFEDNRKDRMPLIVLGNGIMNKRYVEFHCKMVDAAEKIVEQPALIQSEKYCLFCSLMNTLHHR